MTIFVERLLIQLNGNALDQLICHSKLNYTAVVAESNQLYIFHEVKLCFVEFNMGLNNQLL